MRSALAALALLLNLASVAAYLVPTVLVGGPRFASQGARRAPGAGRHTAALAMSSGGGGGSKDNNNFGSWDAPKPTVTVPGDRRYVSPYEKRDLMGTPMQTGVVRSERDAKGASQKGFFDAKLKESTGLERFEQNQGEAHLHEDWEELVSSDGRKYYKNMLTGAQLTTRPTSEVEGVDVAAVAEGVTAADKQFVSEWADGVVPSDIFAYSSSDGDEDDGGGKKGQLETTPVFDVWGSVSEEPGELDAALVFPELSEETASGTASPTVADDEEAPLLLGRNVDDASGVEDESEVSKRGRDAASDNLFDTVMGTYTLERTGAPATPLPNPTSTTAGAAGGAGEGGGTGNSERAQREEALRSQLSSGGVNSASGTPVPPELAPGQNRGQLNWAEEQLANAQQRQRPPGDLPGFAAPAPTEGAAGEGGGKDELIPLWNPIPFLNPEKPRVGVRKDVWAGYSGVPGQDEEPQQDPKLQNTPTQNAMEGEEAESFTVSAEKQLDGLSEAERAVIFDDRPELAAGYEFEAGAELGSARTVSMCPTRDVPLLRGIPIDPQERAFTYVDENNCIGCTQCALVARNTFFMEEDNGRARAYSQNGDTPDVVQEAIDCCPVSCIHDVTHEELKFVERAREGEVINNKSRLVGGSYTADEKGGTPWMKLLAKRVREGTIGGILGF